jgi:hypothetical protein
MRYIIICYLFSICFIPKAAAFDLNNEIDFARFVYLYQRALKATANDLQKGAESSTVKKIISDTKIIVDGNDWDVYGVRAERNGKKRRIIFTVGFLLVARDINAAVAEMWIDNDLDSLVDYLLYLADKLKESDVAVRTGQPIPGYMNYCVFRGNSLEYCAQRDKDATLIKTLSRVEWSSLAFLLGHELGHHALKHLENGRKFARYEHTERTKKSDEAMADLYGTELMVRAGILADGAIGPLILFYSLKRESPLDSFSQAGHPHPLCRWISILERQSDLISKIPSLLSALEQAGSSQAELTRGMDSLRSVAPGCMSGKQGTAIGPTIR